MDDLKRYVPLAVTVISFFVGVSMVLGPLNQTLPMWMLPVGILILVVSYPLGYYHFSKLRDGYRGSRQDDALQQAREEAGVKELDDAKK